MPPPASRESDRHSRGHRVRTTDTPSRRPLPDAQSEPPAGHGGGGVFASQHLRWAISEGIVDAGHFKIPPSSIQPASIDLRLGEVAYRIRSSFLPRDLPVETKLKDLVVDEIDIRKDGAVLETERPYLIPLLEEARFPDHVRGKANPKSSTGRLDVFTRVITDYGHRFDDIPYGYKGPLYLEVVPLSFTVKVRQHLSLNQLRLEQGDTKLTDREIHDEHGHHGILFRSGRALDDHELPTNHGLFLEIDLRRNDRPVGYRARSYTPLIDMAAHGAYDAKDYWEAVEPETRERIVLAPECFYLLLSQDNVRIPPHLAAEMTAFDPTSGELRTHYAGFFDPGFGHDPDRRLAGSRAALEVRAHDVPFMIEHGQRLCKLTFDRMLEEPDVLYGAELGSAYQGQEETLSKHFRDRNPPLSETAGNNMSGAGGQPGLFDDSGL